MCTYPVARLRTPGEQEKGGKKGALSAMIGPCDIGWVADSKGIREYHRKEMGHEIAKKKVPGKMTVRQIGVGTRPKIAPYDKGKKKNRGKKRGRTEGTGAVHNTNSEICQNTTRKLTCLTRKGTGATENFQCTQYRCAQTLLLNAQLKPLGKIKGIIS